MRSRFKAIAVVNNQEVINMARLITPFNGKPVLITESGSLTRGARTPGAGGQGGGTPDPVPGPGGSEGAADSASNGGGGSDGGGSSSGSSNNSFSADDFLELDIHVRRWNFMARKGLNKLSSKFGVINVSVAFLVEGREDAEVTSAGGWRGRGGGATYQLVACSESNKKQQKLRCQFTKN